MQETSCLVDTSLLPLAATTFTAEDVLQASLKPRKCPSGKLYPLGRERRLIYVTPWNKDGYKYTTLHSDRISHIVPVWYQVKLQGSKVNLNGAQDVQQDWLASLHSSTKVLPRFEIIFPSKKEVEAVLFFPRGEVRDMIKAIVEEVVHRGYDGATLELPFTAQMTNLIQQLGTALHKEHKELVLVIPADHLASDRSPFSRTDAMAVLDAVDHFSLNSYDHASALGTDSGNAPLPWLQEILDALLLVRDDDNEEDPFSDDVFKSHITRQIDRRLADKLFMGLNFYGITFTTEGVINTITATEYRGLVEFSTMSIPLIVEWDAMQAEHRMDGRLWSIWYPTPRSVLTRVELAREYGVGISVWEAGQGMDYLWDVLF